MKVILVLCLFLTGCATMERYPRTTKFVAASIALSAIYMIDHGGKRGELVTLPSDPCKTPEMCK